jgi:hypothetical protein
VVQKTVINDDGGLLTVADFNITTSAGTLTFGTGEAGTVPGSLVYTATIAGLSAADYDLAELDVTGYSEGSWSCSNGAGGAFGSGSATVANGATTTCSITNDDESVDNGANPGGTAGPDNWTLSATAASPVDGRNLSNLGGSGVLTTVFANTSYVLAEEVVLNGDTGYQVKTNWRCVDAQGASVTVSSDAVTLALDTDVTCTIVNEAKGAVELNKTTIFQGSPANDSYMWDFGIYLGPNEGGSSDFLGDPLATDATAPGDNVLDFGIKLDPNQTYTVCELQLPAGWSTFWQVDTDNDFIADTTVIPYNPNATDSPTADLGNRCYDFNVGIGSKFVFAVENDYPGGDPRTPGYWKNWNRVTGGGQADNSDRNGSYTSGFWLLEHVLDTTITGGITWDDVLADAFVFPITEAAVAVDILDQREIGDPLLVGDGGKHSNDAAYTLAMHLLAAQLNFGAGAESCDAARDAVVAGEELLDKYDFNGAGDYLLNNNRQTKQDYNRALELAAQLDQYNNGELCSGPGVSIESPVGGHVLTDPAALPLPISATVVDVFGIAQVEFFVDGVSIGVDNDANGGWSATWDWANWDGGTPDNEGDHVITAVATNTNPAGAETGSADVTVTVDLVADVPIHVVSLASAVAPDKGGKWTATVTATIVDNLNGAVENATVTGVWGDGSVGSCITAGTAGACDVSITNNKNTVSTSFTVTDVTHPAFVYDSSANVVSDTGPISPP